MALLVTSAALRHSKYGDVNFGSSESSKYPTPYVSNPLINPISSMISMLTLEALYASVCPGPMLALLLDGP